MPLSIVRGETGILRCQTDDSFSDVIQIKNYNDGPGGTVLFDSQSGDVIDPDKYTVEGHYNLIIAEMDWEDGGLYGCELIGINGVLHTVDAVVMGECRQHNTCGSMCYT